MSSLAVAANRAPVAFVRRPDGTLERRRGVGGLVTALGGAVRGRDSVWVAAALTDGDREMVEREGGRVSLPVGDGNLRVRLIAPEEADYNLYYNELANRVLWFLHHYLWSAPDAPSFGRAETEAWDAFGRVNALFAATLAEESAEGAIALPQDYHLPLVPPLLRAKRPDLRIAQFWHIPFCQPDQYRILPEAWGRALLEGLLAADLVGFQTKRWAENFLACCRSVLGARTTARAVRWGDRTVRVGIYPVGVNPEHLAEEAGRPEVEREAAAISSLAGDRVLLLRSDRTELSKNIARGLAAYEAVLERRDDLRGRVVHLALLTPSRRNVPEYQAYVETCRRITARINTRFGSAGWEPVTLEIEDNFPRSLAAYRRYDVLVVNPVYDGMNLVAREGPILNERDGVLVLSRNAGAAEELGPAALLVNPFDVEATTAAIEAAIEMPAAERRRRAKTLRRLARGTPPERWLEAQLRDATPEH